MKMVLRNTVTLLHLMLLIGIVNSQQTTPLQCGSTTLILDEFYETYAYPGSGLYPTDTTCGWILQAADPNSRITFEVSEIFVDCGDTLKFYDGSSSSATALTATNVCCTSSTSCGSARPPQTTTGNTIFIEFRSDGTQFSYESGFKVSFLTGKDASNCALSGTNNAVTIDTETVLTSPNFPAKYPMNFICTNTYTNPGGMVSVQFKYFDVEEDTSSPGACFDSVEIFDGASTSSSLIVKLCGTTVPSQSFTSTGESLTIKFTSDIAEPKIGFYANVIPVGEETTKTTITTTRTTTETTTTNPITTTKTTPKTTRIPTKIKKCCLKGRCKNNKWCRGI